MTDHEDIRDRGRERALASLPTLSLSADRRRRILAAAAAEAAGRPAAPHRRRQLADRRLLAGLAAAAIVVLLLAPSLPWRRGTAPPTPVAGYSPEQVETAREQARYGLALAARIVKRSERAALADVFRHRLPEVIRGTLGDAIQRTRGDEG